MKKTPAISFADNVTAAEAFIFAMRYLYIFFRNVWRAQRLRPPVAVGTRRTRPYGIPRSELRLHSIGTRRTRRSFPTRSKSAAAGRTALLRTRSKKGGREMKKFLKQMRQRISDALKLLFCGRYSLYMFYKGMPDSYIYSNIVRDAVEKSLNKDIDDGYFPPFHSGGQESIIARLQMIEAALHPDLSVIMLIKEYGRCYVIYDCQSQTDFDELLNQEIK